MTEGVDPPEAVSFEESFGDGARAILAIAGLVPLLAPWELLVRPSVSTFDAATLLPWLVSAGAVAVGLPLLAVALLGLRRTVTVDPREGIVSELTQASFRLAWTRTQALARVSGICVEPEEWSDGPPAWCVVARFGDGTRPWRLTRCAARDDALAVATDVAARAHLSLSTS